MRVLLDPTPGQTPPPASGADGALEALTRPAFVEIAGRLVGTCPRLWLDWCSGQVAASLRRLLSRPVQAGLADGPVAPARPFYGVEVDIGGPSLLIGLDRAAARAVIDALSSDAAGIRGNGVPTEAEQGLLDFAALSCIDDLVKAGGEHLGGLSLRRLVTDRDGPWWDADGPLPLAVRLRVGGSEGMVLIRSAAPIGDVALPPPAAEPARGTVEVGLALAPVALTPAEWGSVAAGDVLLFGVSAAQRDRLRGWLQTSTGWRVCAAEVVHDNATLTTVSCGCLDPGVGPAPEDAGRPVLVPVLGSAGLRLDRLAGLRAGDTIDLPKSGGAPVRLVRAGRCVAQGELIALDGELGVRILGLGSPPGAGM